MLSTHEAGGAIGSGWCCIQLKAAGDVIQYRYGRLPGVAGGSGGSEAGADRGRLGAQGTAEQGITGTASCEDGNK